MKLFVGLCIISACFSAAFYARAEEGILSPTEEEVSVKQEKGNSAVKVEKARMNSKKSSRKSAKERARSKRKCKNAVAKKEITPIGDKKKLPAFSEQKGDSLHEEITDASLEVGTDSEIDKQGRKIKKNKRSKNQRNKKSKKMKKVPVEEIVSEE